MRRNKWLQLQVEVKSFKSIVDSAAHFVWFWIKIFFPNIVTSFRFTKFCGRNNSFRMFGFHCFCNVSAHFPTLYHLMYERKRNCKITIPKMLTAMNECIELWNLTRKYFIFTLTEISVQNEKLLAFYFHAKNFLTDGEVEWKRYMESKNIFIVNVSTGQIDGNHFMKLFSSGFHCPSTML